MVNTAKQNLVQNLVDLLDKNNNFAIVKFDKTTHQSMETLRRGLKPSKSSLKVIKNTLFEKSVLQLGTKNKLYKELAKTYFPLKENTAVLVLGDDWGAGIKVFHEFSKKDSTVDFKLAILDKVIYPKEEVTRIAELPSKEQLVAKLIGQLKTPMTKLVYAMKYNSQKFTYILSQKSKQTN